MAALVFFQSAVERIIEGGIVLHTDQLKVALCAAASAPDAAADAVIADVTQIAYTNLSSRNITTVASGRVGGLYSLEIDDLLLSASGGAVAGFRYVLMFSDTSAGDMLICYWDLGADVVIPDGDSLNLVFQDGKLLEAAG